jgi:hypothetical protein
MSSSVEGVTWGFLEYGTTASGSDIWHAEFHAWLVAPVGCVPVPDQREIYYLIARMRWATGEIRGVLTLLNDCVSILCASKFIII